MCALSPRPPAPPCLRMHSCSRSPPTPVPPSSPRAFALARPGAFRVASTPFTRSVSCHGSATVTAHVPSAARRSSRHRRRPLHRTSRVWTPPPSPPRRAISPARAARRVAAFPRRVAAPALLMSCRCFLTCWPSFVRRLEDGTRWPMGRRRPAPLSSSTRHRPPRRCRITALTTTTTIAPPFLAGCTRGASTSRDAQSGRERYASARRS